MSPFAVPFLVLLAAAPALARGKEILKAHLMPTVARCRSDAPMSAEVKFDWQGTRVLEGRLDIIFRSGNEVLGRYRSAELALTSGEQVKSMMLPAIRNTTYGPQISAEMRFLTGGAAYRLGTDTLFAPTTAERSFVICVSEPRGVANPRRFRVVNGMRLEGLAPERLSAGGQGDPTDRPLSTYPAHLAPEELPAFALGYCSYDVVLLADEGFSDLQKRRLDALGSWVAAGGSVCVIPGTGLKEYHVEFLNGLAGSDKAAVDFVMGERGTVLHAGSPEGQVPRGSDGTWRGRSGIATLHAGLGRAVVVTGPLDSDRDLDSAEWREAVAFLWKVRAGHRESILKTGKWRKDAERTPSRRRHPRLPRYGTGSGKGFEFHVMPIQVGGDLLKTLIPRTVRLVPFGLVVFILVLFVLAIGPIDYFVLGKLRRRSLTWAVFPAVSICFALFTVYLSNRYMGRTDHRNSVTFVDLGKGGRVLRRSSYEVIFAAGNKTALTPVSGGIFAALDHKEFGDEGEYYRYYGRPSYDREVPPPMCEGRMPSGYVVRQQIRQWTPQLNRYFAMGPVQASINLDWDSIDPAAFRASSFAGRVRTAILRGRVKDTSVHVHHGRAVNDVIGRGSIFPSEVLKRVSRRSEEGLFSVVSQISPTGGPNFEDVSLLDSTDPGQWLLVVVTQEKGNYIVYRRLYHRAAKATADERG